MTKEEALSMLIKPFYEMGQRNEVSGDLIKQIYYVAGAAFDEWQNFVVAELENQIDSWKESFEEEEDKSLYTLGLYRAIDLVQGKDSIKEAESRVENVQEATD